MTSAHFLVSAAMNAPKSLPKAVPGSEPSSRMRATMSGASSALATSSRSRASTGSGVFDGATRPYQEEASKPTRPCSPTVGTSGSADGRFAPALASARTLPAAGGHVGCARRPLRPGIGERAHLARRNLRQHYRHEVEEHLDVAGDEIVHRWSRAAIGHVDDIDVGHALEQFAGKVIGRTVAGRGEIELARLFLRQRDQLLHAVRPRRD